MPGNLRPLSSHKQVIIFEMHTAFLSGCAPLVVQALLVQFFLYMFFNQCTIYFLTRKNTLPTLGYLSPLEFLKINPRK